MKASEAIEKLQKLIQDNGDLELRIHDTEWEDSLLEEITLERVEGKLIFLAH